MKCVLLAVMAFAATMKLGSAVECYYCVPGTGCNDPFDSTSDNVETVTAGCDYCVKTKDGVSDSSSVSRSCASGTMPYTNCEDVTVSGSTVTECYCEGALCNGGSTLALSFTALLMCAVFKKIVH